MTETQQPVSIDMVLYCPECGEQHLDEAAGDWTNPPHRSHLCHGCGHIWRPADVPTNGVLSVRTMGLKDSPIVVRAYHRREGKAP
jgi:rubredoxin